eukprot:7496972-Pyramimonas_sp.AAC.1
MPLMHTLVETYLRVLYTTDQSDAGSAGIFSRRTHHVTAGGPQRRHQRRDAAGRGEGHQQESVRARGRGAGVDLNLSKPHSKPLLTSINPSKPR